MEFEGIIKTLFRRGAIVTGHVVDEWGLHHPDGYPNKEVIVASPLMLKRPCKPVGDFFSDGQVDFVLGRGSHGAALAQWLAMYLTTIDDTEVYSGSVQPAAERRGRERRDLRSTDYTISEPLKKLIKNKRVLLIDDVLLLPEVLKKMRVAAESWGGSVVGAAVIWDATGKELNHSHHRAVLGVPAFTSVIQGATPAQEPDQCSVCLEGKVTKENWVMV